MIFNSFFQEEKLIGEAADTKKAVPGGTALILLYLENGC